MRTPCRTPGCPNPTNRTTPHCNTCTHRTGKAHRITLVCGPPCSGKNTYVHTHAHPGDLVVDLDALYHALNANPTRPDHDQPPALRPFAFDARDAIINRLLHGDHNLRAAWIIASAPKAEQRSEWKQRGARIVMLTATRTTLTHRARTHRPTPWTNHIDDWHNQHTPGFVDETIDTTPQ